MSFCEMNFCEMNFCEMNFCEMNFCIRNPKIARFRGRVLRLSAGDRKELPRIVQAVEATAQWLDRSNFQ